MTKIYLIRHAEAEGNLYRRIHGQYNSLVTDNGYSQIAALEHRFADIHVDAVYASDLFRPMTTAGAIIFLINPGKKLLVFNLFDKVYLGEYPMASLIATLIIVIVLAVEGLVWLISRKEGKGYVS